MSLSFSHERNNLSSGFKVYLSKDFQFDSKRKVKHVKIECIGLKPGRGRSARQGGAVMGRPTHGGGRVAHSRAHFGQTLVSVVHSRNTLKFASLEIELK